MKGGFFMYGSKGKLGVLAAGTAVLPQLGGGSTQLLTIIGFSLLAILGALRLYTLYKKHQERA